MADNKFDLGDYKTVPERIADFREKYPEGSLRPLLPERPFWMEMIGERVFVCYVAAAFRTPEDPCPGVGSAWEPFPGKTSYTRDSELQNAETSAWGRAIIAALASDAKGGVATMEEVRNRRDAPPDPPPEPLADAEDVQALRDRIDALPDEQKAVLKQRWSNLVNLRPYRLDNLPARFLDLVRDLVNGAEAQARAATEPAQDRTGATERPPVAPPPGEPSKRSQEAQAAAQPVEQWVRHIEENVKAMTKQEVTDHLDLWSLPKGGSDQQRRKRIAVHMVKDHQRSQSSAAQAE